MRRKLLAVVLTAAVVLVAAEAFARIYLGLGDPPLTIRDPQIEYMFAPSRSYARLGHRIAYNAYSMRSDDFPPRKATADEVRILVLGDSVVNGGALTDQDDLATGILQRRLQEEYGLSAAVGNISAGSWGPGNLLAYVKRFGWFDADLAFIVVSSHDLGDVPLFPDDLGPEFPDAPPVVALEEVVLRYLPRYLPGLPSIRHAAGPSHARPEDRALGSRYLSELLTEAKMAVPRVMLLLHPTPAEIQEGLSPDGRQIMKIASDLDVPSLSVATRMDGGTSVYHRDDIHISATGQRLYAEILVCESLAVLADQACGE